MLAGAGECVVLHPLGCIYCCIGSLTTTPRPAQAGRSVLRAFLACKCRTRGKRAANTAGGVSPVYLFVENITRTYRSWYYLLYWRTTLSVVSERTQVSRRASSVCYNLPSPDTPSRSPSLFVLTSPPEYRYWYSKLPSQRLLYTIVQGTGMRRIYHPLSSRKNEKRFAADRFLHKVEILLYTWYLPYLVLVACFFLNYPLYP